MIKWLVLNLWDIGLRGGLYNSSASPSSLISRNLTLEGFYKFVPVTIPWLVPLLFKAGRFPSEPEQLELSFLNIFYWV
jgi:hypothetical protein